MALAIHRPVARRRFGVIHIVSQVSGIVVMTKCGNTLVAPKQHRLRGPICTVCIDPVARQ